MHDRDKVINWWVGRMSDQDLAEWTGMAPRAVGIVLNLPHMRAGISGGGRGSKNTRRIEAKTRNAVAIIHAMSEAGMTFELATNIIAATPVLASMPTQVIDWHPILSGIAPLMVADPAGSWLPTDKVPENIWGRFVYPCYSVDNPQPTAGDILEVPYGDFAPNTDRGTMLVDRSAFGMPNLELKPLTDKPVYAGEIDPLGLYTYENYRSEALPRFDDHVLVVNGHWVFIKSPDPRPMEAMQNVMAGEFNQSKPIKYDLDPVSVIESDKKTVRVIGWGRDEEEQERARYHLANFDSLLDVNMTLAVRKMKRRAYGLPVTPPASPVPWADRAKLAQRYEAPTLVKIDAEAETRKIEEEDFFRGWTTDAEGNRIRVGLTKEENEEFEVIEKKDWENRMDHTAFPWASVKERRDEEDRWHVLHGKHERARQQRIGEEFRKKHGEPSQD